MYRLWDIHIRGQYLNRDSAKALNSVLRFSKDKNSDKRESALNLLLALEHNWTHGYQILDYYLLLHLKA